jgi:hypothetical protein
MKKTATKENLFFLRNNLAMNLRNVNILVEKLIKENINLKGYEKDKFFERLELISELIETISEYDELLQIYIGALELTSQSTYYKEKYLNALKYIEQLGGDVNVPRWS